MLIERTGELKTLLDIGVSNRRKIIVDEYCVIFISFSLPILN